MEEKIIFKKPALLEDKPLLSSATKNFLTFDLSASALSALSGYGDTVIGRNKPTF